MHGEQGALVCTAKIVETVPWIDAKYYAATQVMDEARHVEVFAKYLDTKLSGHYPINAHLRMLLDDIIEDSRWDMTYLGMQIMVEGLALAAFGFMHQMTTEPLLKQLLRYVMSDEARHVAFGVLSLKEYYGELSDAEMRERQEFAFEAAVRMRDRFLQQEVWERMGIDAQGRRQDGAAGAARASCSRACCSRKIVPNCKKLGLLDRNDGWLREQVHRDGRHPVRGLGRHRRGVRDVRARRGGDRISDRPATRKYGPGAMSTPSDPRTLVMHGLRLKGFAEASGVAEAVGVAEADAKPMLDQLVVDGLATYRDGRLSGFALTTKAGREHHAELVSTELDGAGVRAGGPGRLHALPRPQRRRCSRSAPRGSCARSTAVDHQRPHRHRLRRRRDRPARRAPRPRRPDLRRPRRRAAPVRRLRPPALAARSSGCAPATSTGSRSR